MITFLILLFTILGVTTSLETSPYNVKYESNELDCVTKRQLLVTPLAELVGGEIQQRNLTKSEEKHIRKHPVVEKFMMNIYNDVFYNQSALNDYVVAFYGGFGMSDYAFADECLLYST